MSVLHFTVSILLFSNFVVSDDNDRKNSKIVFPDSLEAPEKNTKEIPLDLIRRLNEVTNVEELFQNLIEPIPSASLSSETKGNLPLSISARFGLEPVERSALKTAKMAKCMPELRTVPLKPDKNSATFFYPSCTRVERCGGCCSHHLLSCQPVESEIIPMTVVVADYLGGNKLEFKGKKVVEVEQHTKCKCECKIRPENCSRYQKYNQDKCICECTNTDEERKCHNERPKKIWNTDNCSCQCREEEECGSGYYFDPFTCSCVMYRGRKKPSFLYNVN